MTAKDGRPCARCGTSAWDKRGSCFECARSRTRQWTADNPERKRTNDRAYQEKNREKLNAQSVIRKKKNWSRHLEICRNWRKNNAVQARAAVKKWEQENRDKINGYQHVRRARVTTAGGRYTKTEWEGLCNKYGNKCLACGKTGIQLTPDHVVPISRGGSNNIDNIQPLCLSCNQSKNAKTIDYRQGVTR